MAKSKIIAEPGKPEVVSVCEFDAPRELVFKAYTDPKLIVQWWAPRKYNISVDRMEVKPGGMWRFVARYPDGREGAMHGFYHRISAPGRIVNTFEYEGNIALETVTIEERNGRTKLTDQFVFQSVEIRDRMFKTVMEESFPETMDLLEEVLAKEKVPASR